MKSYTRLLIVILFRTYFNSSHPTTVTLKISCRYTPTTYMRVTLCPLSQHATSTEIFERCIWPGTASERLAGSSRWCVGTEHGESLGYTCEDSEEAQRWKGPVTGANPFWEIQL